jgi:hypothetical protein
MQPDRIGGATRHVKLKAAIDKAIIAARLAYQFSPGSYTASALSEICAVRKLLETDQE